jgi:hypothetical protein
VQTLNPPDGAHGFFVTVETNPVYMTFDGTAPSSSNGLHVQKDTAPIFIPASKPLKFASDTAGNAVVNILWVS